MVGSTVLQCGLILGGLATLVGAFGMGRPSRFAPSEPHAAQGSEPAEMGIEIKEPTYRVAILGAGCFWCPEPIFESLAGVVDVEAGYAGGIGTTNYAEVCSGRTNWCEVVRVTYDPKVLSTEDLLRVFFVIHDPTTLNRQGNDVGPRYRSAIFYSTPEEKQIALQVLREVGRLKLWPNPIVTTVEPTQSYVRAEDEHQDYWTKWSTASITDRMKMNDGYCRAIVDPKVRKFRKQLMDKLKPEYREGL